MPVPSYEPPAYRPQTGFIAAMKRGLRRRCPACGLGRLFAGYLTMSPTCDRCGQDLEVCRADDAPAYFTIMIVGHIVVPGLLMVEQLYKPDILVQMGIWLPVTLISSLLLLPFVKGATIGAVFASRR